MKLILSVEMMEVLLAGREVDLEEEGRDTEAVTAAAIVAELIKSQRQEADTDGGGESSSQEGEINLWGSAVKE